MTDPTSFDGVDYFFDRDVTQNPYAYYEYLRAQCPIHREPQHDVLMVSGFDEAMAIYSQATTFSSANTVAGPFTPFPVTIVGVGDDVSDLVDRHRDELPFTDQLPSFDPPKHTLHRGLMMRLITPKRLKENEDFMWRYADQQLDEFLADGRCEFNTAYAAPYTLLVIADLLGVPEADHGAFREHFANPMKKPGGKDMAHKPLEFLYEQFGEYIEARRGNPQGDAMSELANSDFADGTTPTAHDVALIAANLFVAGQETTVRLLSAMLAKLGDDQELQSRLRANRSLIPAFVEEVLRMESPLKGEFRLARRTTTVGDVEIPAGSCVMLLNGAANRDPRRFEDPDEFRLDRVNGRHHLAFGHGVHTCAGAPLARSEARISLERLFDRTSSITISEEHHGPIDARRYKYVPTYMLRGLRELHIEFTTA